MATTTLLFSTSSIFILLVALLFAGAQAVGVCYGGKGNNLPNMKEVIQLYKSNGIGKIRLYSADEAILDALRGSHIHVMVGIPNDQLQSLATPGAAATNWVQKYIKARIQDVKFQYIVVGNKVPPTDPRAQFVLPAMRNIQNAITAANLQHKIKVSTAINSIGLLSPSSFSPSAGSFSPSAGSFSEAAKKFITPIVSFLVDNHSPLLANVYPYFSYKRNPNVKLRYALFTSQPNDFVKDGKFVYHNLFDSMVDTLYAALEKLSGGNIPIVISESGWPSAGDKSATVENAGTYYKNLLSHVKRRKGTPKRPGKDIKVFLFAMFDENLEGPEEIEKHFGLFTPSKQPKYQLTFK